MHVALRTSYLLILAVPLHAQDKPRMTLDDAVREARANNPAYQSAQFQVQATELSVRSRWGQFLPSLDLNLGWGGSSRTTETGTGDFGESVEVSQPITFENSNASQSIGGSVTLFDGLSNVNTLSAAKYDVSAAEEGVRLSGLQVQFDVSQRFYDAIRAASLIDVEGELLQSAQERLDAIERLFQVTGATQTDVLGAQVDVARQALQLERQHAAARKARLQVLETVGVLDQYTDFEPVGTFPAVFDPTSLMPGDLVTRALVVHPRISQSEYNVESSSKTYSASKGTWLPTLSVSGSYSRLSNEAGYGAIFDFNPVSNTGYGFQLGVSWPIFDGFQRQQQIGQADVSYRQAEEDLRQTKLEVEQQVRSALIDLQTAYEALLTQRRSTQLSRTRVELAREQYVIGASGMTFTNLQQIIDGASAEERALVEAEYQFAVALVALELQVGERVRPQ